MQVTPVIGVIDAGVRSQLRASDAEVEAIFDCPLEMFLEDSPTHKHKDVWWNDVIQYRCAAALCKDCLCSATECDHAPLQ